MKTIEKLWLLDGSTVFNVAYCSVECELLDVLPAQLGITAIALSELLRGLPNEMRKKIELRFFELGVQTIMLDDEDWDLYEKLAFTIHQPVIDTGTLSSIAVCKRRGWSFICDAPGGVELSISRDWRIEALTLKKFFESSHSSPLSDFHQQLLSAVEQNIVTPRSHRKSSSITL